MSNAPRAGAPGHEFERFAATWQPRVERTLDELLPGAAEDPVELHRAMRHAMFPGGKRLRPMLALLAARVTGGDVERALLPAAGLECLHTYSLVHDDLPCMDDDDLRRGRPTCHKAYSEATALCAGDALLTLAFEAVAGAGGPAVRALARAAGSLGMVGGQIADLAAEGRGADLSLHELERIHDRKTGALITASLEVGALAGGRPGDAIEPLCEYGRLIGRAFQIADDCLDVTGTAAELGKAPGQDEAHAKATYPALLGLEASLAAAKRLCEEAAALAPRICAAGAGGADSAGRDPGGLDSEIRLLQDVGFYIAARRA